MTSGLTKTKKDSENLNESKTLMENLIAEGKERGFISLKALKEVLPSKSQTEEAMEVIISSLVDMGIQVVEENKSDENRINSPDRFGWNPRSADT